MTMKSFPRVYDIQQLKDHIRANGDTVEFGKQLVTAVELAENEFLLYCRNAVSYISDFTLVGLFVRKEDAPNGELYTFEKHRPWFGMEMSLDALMAMKRDVIASELWKICDNAPLSRNVSNGELALAKREALDIIVTGKSNWFEPQISDEEALQCALGIRGAAEIARDNFQKHDIYMQRKLIAAEAERFVKSGLNESKQWQWCLNAASDIHSDYIVLLFRYNRRRCEAYMLKEDFLEMLAEGSNVTIKASDIPRGEMVFKHLLGKQYTMNSALTLNDIEEIRGEFKGNYCE